jgi:anti-sigma B factor antagonist
MRTSGPVIVMELPKRLKHTDVEKFLGELQPLLESGNPRIVLDCSQVRYVDSAGVEMLRRSMQEAMERNGHIKLAAILPASSVILELMRVDRLIETFENAEEAVESFRAFPSYPARQSEPQPGVYSDLGDLKAAS